MDRVAAHTVCVSATGLGEKLPVILELTLVELVHTIPLASQGVESLKMVC